MTRTPHSQRSRSPGRFTHRRVGASGSCSGERGNVSAAWKTTATLRSARRREELWRPQREERGGGISWRPPARLQLVREVKDCRSYFCLLDPHLRCSRQDRQTVCEHGRTRAEMNSFEQDGHVISSSSRLAPNGLEQLAISHCIRYTNYDTHTH